MRDDFLQKLSLKNSTKMVLLIMDGVGDIPHPDFNNKTPLEAAKKPNIDKLSKSSALGRIIPVFQGITPGSGPGHLGLFGYDPIEHDVGRGVIEALGLDIEMKLGDVSARANFATMDDKGIIIDRRAGRLDTDKNIEICNILRQIKKIEDIDIIIESGVQHRFVVLFRGPGLDGEIADIDPHKEGNPILNAKPLTPKGEKTARIIDEFVKRGLALIKDKHPANAFLMRGFSTVPEIPPISRFNIKPCCIATYPMYRGLSKLIGMDIINTGTTVEDEFNTYIENYDKYDYFFIHVKGTDKAGEDGNFSEKVKYIEEVDKALPTLMKKAPDVLVITGDHSTPAYMKGHSWHPVPLMLQSKICGADDNEVFTENSCNKGALGIFESKYLLGLMLANAGRLDKYGA